MLIVGIDPGAKGAIAFTDGKNYSVIGMLDVEGWIAQMQTHTSNYVYFVESVTASPQMGVVSAFTFGKGFGQLLGVLKAFKAKYRLVKPQLWQGRLGLSFPGQDIDYREKKKKCYEAAKKMFPNVKVTRDNADALLIAEYGRRVLNE